jgi:large subunit ribosomal protein L28
MSRRCELTGKGVLVGNKVSHSNRKSKRTFRPNLQNFSLYSEILNQSIKLRLATNTIRSVDVNGGLDSFLLKKADKDLTPEAIVLKNRIKKVQQEKNQVTA